MKKLKRSSWIKLCPRIIMWSLFFLSSSIKIITQLQWRKHGKSECKFFSCHVCDVIELEMIMPCIQLLCSVIGGSRGVELFQGHGFEIEPICLLWQSLFYWFYTIGTLNFEMKIRCIILFRWNSTFSIPHKSL